MEEMERLGLRPASHALPWYSNILCWTGQFERSIEHSRKVIQASREANDICVQMYALPHLGAALAASGRYADAARTFEEARDLGRKYGIGSFLARSIGFSAGFHLDVFDFAGAEALSEEARDLGRSVSFPGSIASGGIDLLFNFARRHEPGRAEALLGEVEAAIGTAKGSHAWLWRHRLAQARAELSLERRDWDAALRFAEDALEQARSKHRLKYQALALEARAKALVEKGRKREAIDALRGALAIARPLGDPAVLLRAALALLAVEGDDGLLAEARDAARRIAAALPDAVLRRRFAEAEGVGRLLG